MSEVPLQPERRGNTRGCSPGLGARKSVTSTVTSAVTRAGTEWSRSGHAVVTWVTGLHLGGAVLGAPGPGFGLSFTA